MLEVWSSTAAVRYANGRVVVSPLRADDDTALDTALADLHQVLLGISDDGDGALLFQLRSPDFPVNGLPNLRCPVSMRIDADTVDKAREFVTRINNDLLELRRTRRQGMPPTPPAPMPSPQGPRRPDVDAAAGRMRLADRRLAGLVEAVQVYCRDEQGHVLEMAPAGYRGAPGLVVITTVRLLFVSSNGFTHEFPLDAIEWAQVAQTGPGGLWALRIADGDSGLSFEDRQPDDLGRVAAAVNYACDVQRGDGGIGPVTPSSAQLYAEWETLLERRQLDMIPDEQFQDQAFGILLAVSGE